MQSSTQAMTFVANAMDIGGPIRLTADSSKVNLITITGILSAWGALVISEPNFGDVVGIMLNGQLYTSSVEQLAKIYERIESLSTSNLEKPAEILVVEHFVPVLTASLILYGITLILSRTILRRLP